MKVKYEANTGGSLTRRHTDRGRLVDAHTEVIADIEIHQVCVYRGIHYVRPPEKKEEKHGVVLILAKLISVGAQGIIVAIGYKG